MMTAPTDLAPPNSAPQRGGSGTNFEKNSWVFMRVSGVILVVLVLGHLLIMNILDGGVQRINFAFVAGRWSSPFWQFWDLTMLWLAMLHGTNGLRVIIGDYAKKGETRFRLRALLYIASAATVILGTLVIFTFDPNLA